MVALAAAPLGNAHARDVTKDPVADDGSGAPQGPPPENPAVYEQVFTPVDGRTFVKFTNVYDQAITLMDVHVRLDGSTSSGCTSPTSITCSSGSVSAESPIRTSVLDGPLTTYAETDGPVDLGITLAPCESILIEALDAAPGQAHVVSMRFEYIANIFCEQVGYLEIWDGECND